MTTHKTVTVQERLVELHRKMLSAVKTQRPYPVKIALGDSDLDTVLDAAVALDRANGRLEILQELVARFEGLLTGYRDQLPPDFGIAAVRDARKALTQLGGRNV
jgi:hypothetical protein